MLQTYKRAAEYDGLVAPETIKALVPSAYKQCCLINHSAYCPSSCILHGVWHINTMNPVFKTHPIHATETAEYDKASLYMVSFTVL